MRRSSIAASVVSIFLLATLLFIFWKYFESEQESESRDSESILVEQAFYSRVVLNQEREVRYVGGLAFEEQYLSPENHCKDDLRLLSDVMRGAILTLKDFPRYRMADSRDLAWVLAGGNSSNLSWLSPSHRCLTKDGAVADRWGNEIILHQQSALNIELRSSGPDGEPYTDDDVIYQSSSERRAIPLLK